MNADYFILCPLEPQNVGSQASIADSNLWRDDKFPQRSFLSDEFQRNGNFIYDLFVIYDHGDIT